MNNGIICQCFRLVFCIIAVPTAKDLNLLATTHLMNNCRNITDKLFCNTKNKQFQLFLHIDSTSDSKCMPNRCDILDIPMPNFFITSTAGIALILSTVRKLRFTYQVIIFSRFNLISVNIGSSKAEVSNGLIEKKLRVLLNKQINLSQYSYKIDGYRHKNEQL